MGKTLNSRRFGQLLSTAVKRIAAHEDKNIALIQDEIGYSLRKKNGATYEGGSIIEHWRKGNLPPDLAITFTLAKTLATKKGLEPDECETFLNYAGYPNPASACQEIFSQPSVEGEEPIQPSPSGKSIAAEKDGKPTLMVNIALNQRTLIVAIIAVLTVIVVGVYLWQFRVGEKVGAGQNPFLLEAVYAEERPEINGRLDDAVWDKAQSILFARHPEINDGTTAVVKFLWDEAYLYVGVDVNDTQVEGAGETPWDSDSISVVVENGGRLLEYRHSLIDEIKVDRAGDALSVHWLKANSSFNDPSNLDGGYLIEMRIPLVSTPVENDIISIDLLSVDHDKNPNGAYNSSKTIFSKKFWDGDQTVDEANGVLRFIRE